MTIGTLVSSTSETLVVSTRANINVYTLHAYVDLIACHSLDSYIALVIGQCMRIMPICS